MTGQDLKRMMRKSGCSVKQLARYLQTTDTDIRKRQGADAGFFRFDRRSTWERTIRDAARYSQGASEPERKLIAKALREARWEIPTDDRPQGTEGDGQ